MEWQPIESAPKNGNFLVWLLEPHKTMGTNVGIARSQSNVRYINSLFALDLPPATHWMPLPDPPKDVG